MNFTLCVPCLVNFESPPHTIYINRPVLGLGSVCIFNANWYLSEGTKHHPKILWEKFSCVQLKAQCTTAQWATLALRLSRVYAAEIPSMLTICLMRLLRRLCCHRKGYGKNNGSKQLNSWSLAIVERNRGMNKARGKTKSKKKISIFCIFFMDRE